MNYAVNKIGIIESIGEYSIFIKIDNIGMFWYPYHVLEKVENKVEFRFGVKVRAICEDNSIVEGILTGYDKEENSLPYGIAINRERIHCKNIIGDYAWVKSIEYID